MNDELITRTAVMESLKAEYNRRGTGDGLKLAWIEKAVSDTPSAQPEIIRCKDCKYYTSVTAQCEIRGKGLYLIRGMEDFCSRAERRADE